MLPSDFDSSFSLSLSLSRFLLPSLHLFHSFALLLANSFSLNFSLARALSTSPFMAVCFFRSLPLSLSSLSLFLCGLAFSVSFISFHLPTLSLSVFHICYYPHGFILFFLFIVQASDGQGDVAGLMARVTQLQQEKWLLEERVGVLICHYLLCTSFKELRNLPVWLFASGR